LFKHQFHSSKVFCLLFFKKVSAKLFSKSVRGGLSTLIG